MRRMKKLLLPIFFLTVTLGSSVVAAAQCGFCDDYVTSPTRGVLWYCGCDDSYCYYC